MTNEIQKGDVLDYVAGADIASGAVVVLGDSIAVAMQSIANGSTGSVLRRGVVELAAIATGPFTQGQQLFWDANASKLTDVGTGNTPAGMCAEAKLSAGTTAKLELNPHGKRAAKVADASAGSAAEINALRDALIAAGIMLNA